MDGVLFVDLYNFDHGIAEPGTHRFGPYEFLISEEHVASLSQLARHRKASYTYDENQKPIVRHVPATPGRMVKTATARLVDSLPHAPNVLEAGIGDDGFGDLALLLSFLTGRRVRLPSMLTGNESCHYSENVVGGNYFRCNGVAWPRIDLLANEGLVPALWAVVNAKQVPDGIGSMLYASSAFDAISTRWAKSGMSKRSPEEKDEIKVATKAIEKVIEESIADSDRVASCKRKIVSVFEVAAVVKTTAFLASIGLVDLANEDAKGRVALINSVRNMVVHNADIPKRLHDDERRRMEIAVAICVITMEIVCIHLADVANVKDFQVEHSRGELRSFFDTGEFRGQRVFDESYDQFSARMEDEWTSPGR